MIPALRAIAVNARNPLDDSGGNLRNSRSLKAWSLSNSLGNPVVGNLQKTLTSRPGWQVKKLEKS
jgi:hypothetical protein